LFFDYNGNGIQDSGEPAVQGATIQVSNDSGGGIFRAISDSSGDYKVDIPAGRYTLYVQPDNSNPNNPKFTHMCISPSDLRAISNRYDLFVDGDGRFNVGLMEGPFTQPFRSSTDYFVGCYYNWDSRSKETRNSPYLWWNGQSGYNYELFYPQLGGAMYNNAGIDMPMEVGTDVLAPAPGIVSSGPQYGPQGQLGVSIAHPGAGLGSFGVFFNHLSEILLPMGTTVARGDVVAKSGQSGTWTPHLHFNNWLNLRNTAGFFDFYHPEFEITAQTSGYWYPETTWNSVPLGTTPNPLTPIGKNLWTRLNKPTFFV
jgi:murein DD-endopeptidase MepM/ murein hydrolase activator NlpD